MPLTDGTLQKPNPLEMTYKCETEITFLHAEEGVREVLLSAPGKVLLLSDGTSSVLTDAACSPRTIAVVFDGDSLPLFSMPDGVSCVLASGSEELLRAARYFSEVRGIPCTLLPVNADLSGVFELKGLVRLGEEELIVPLREGKVICDIELLRPTLAEAYGRLLLSRLRDLELRALNYFREEKKEFPASESFDDPSPEEIVRANLRQRLSERTHNYPGEGVVLARLLREEGEKFPEWCAYLQLSALYAAFFEKGKPRRYFTPDYRARATFAGTEYSLAGIPSAEEYAVRAITLERIRAPFAKSALELIDSKFKFLKEISALRGEILPIRTSSLTALKSLPEHVPNGLTAIIRDFGLMDWNI